MRSCNDIIRRRIFTQSFFVIIFFGYLVTTLYGVQVVRHNEYYKEARKKYVVKTKLKGSRGQVYDFNGNLLIGNMPRQDVTITPCNIKPQQDAELARILADELNLDYNEVLAKVSRKTRSDTDKNGKTLVRPVKYALITNAITLDAAASLQSRLKEAELDRNVHFEDTFVRFYPKGKFLSNVLGLTAPDHGGTTGIERIFEEKLRSASGSKTYMRTPDGKQIGDAPIAEKSSHNGADFYLTIQEPLQSILEEEIDKACEQWNPKAAYAVLLDPYTGNVLAMTERPTYNPNERKDLDGGLFRLRSIDEYFEPGSIMKPLTVAGALQCKAITPTTKIDCGSSVWYYGGKALTDTHGYGMQDITGVIRKSSNIGTAKIALKMGKRRLYNTLDSFGLGKPTGLPLQPEKNGVLLPVNKWDGLSITRLCIGYSVSCTPVQMARAYCALASRGKLPKLRLVDRMRDPVSGKVTKFEIEKPVEIFDRKVGDQVVNMMVAVTEEGGTAKRAAIPGYRVAGKTGTSYKLIPGKGYSKTDRFTSFAGFVPAEKPAFVLLVMLDSPQYKNNPKKPTFGGSVAAPVWKNIATRVLKYMNIAPTVPVASK